MVRTRCPATLNAPQSQHTQFQIGAGKSDSRVWQAHAPQSGIVPMRSALLFVCARMHAAGSFGVFKSVLNAPLPRIYELSDKGPIPVEKSTMIVGTGVSFENLMASSSDLKAKLQQEVGCSACISACMCPVIKCTELSMHSHQLLLVTQRYRALYQPRPLHDDACRIYWVREMFQFHACAVPWSNPMRSLQTVPACCGQPAKCFLGHH